MKRFLKYFAIGLAISMVMIGLYVFNITAGVLEIHNYSDQPISNLSIISPTERLISIEIKSSETYWEIYNTDGEGNLIFSLEHNQKKYFCYAGYTTSNMDATYTIEIFQNSHVNLTKDSRSGLKYFYKCTHEQQSS